MSNRPMRYNPPPTWPAPPPGWVPPAGWTPDPSWPPAPPGWTLWVQDPPPPWYRRGGVVALLVIGGIMIVGLIGSAFSPDGSEPSANMNAPTASASTPSAPATPLTKQQRVEQALQGADEVKLESVTYGGGDIEVQVTVEDNVTTSYIKRGFQDQVIKTLEAIDGTGVPVTTVTVVGMFPLVDQYGNEEVGEAVTAVYAGRDVAQINYDNISQDQIKELATSWYGVDGF